MTGSRADFALSLLIAVVGCLSFPAHALAQAYPLKKSANGRYLEDQNHIPYLIAGDAPQALMVNLLEADAEMYFANRQSHGFNTFWINLVCNDYTGGRKDGSTYDGILPFTTSGDLTTPNEAYFARCDRMIRLAAKHGLQALVDPIETGGWLKFSSPSPSIGGGGQGVGAGLAGVARIVTTPQLLEPREAARRPVALIGPQSGLDPEGPYGKHS